MKTITIPKRFGYPTLDITVNGKVYTVKSGEEITIEDNLAEAIENAIALEPKVGRYMSKFAQLVERTISEVDESDWDGIKTIAAYAFADCDSITKIIIPNSVNSIKASAFNSCSNLESVVIGNSITNIANAAFDWCQKMAKVYLPEIPPSLENVNAFRNINSACVFYCKTQESLEAYKAAENWSTLTGTHTFVVEE
jgi:hypothetical protein